MKTKKRKGFVMLPVILAAIIVGLLGVGLSSLYSGAFSTLSAEKEAREAQDILDVEKEIIKALGFNDYENGLDENRVTEDSWISMKDILGNEKGSQWEYKLVTVPDSAGNSVRPVGSSDAEAQLRVVKVSVRKKGDTISRASAEVPLSSQGSGTNTPSASSFGMPDYEHGIKISSLDYELNYSVPEDGWALIVKFVNSQGNLGHISTVCQIKNVNGDILPLNNFFNSVNNLANPYGSGLSLDSGLIPVSKNMTIYCKGGFDSSNNEYNEGSTEVDYTVYFYPFKKIS